MVALVRQCANDEVSHRRLVFHDEDCFPAPCFRIGLLIGLGVILFEIRCSRQVDPELRTDTQFAFDLDGTAALLNDPIGGREPKAGPLACRLGRKEGVKNVFEGFGIHAGPVVGDLDAAIIPDFDLPDLCGEGVVNLGVPSAELDCASLRHCIGRIQDKVQDRLLEAGAFAAHQPRFGLAVDFEGDRVWKNPAEHIRQC